MARPKKEAGEARDRLLQIRLMQKEYDQYREAAESDGLDLSAWVRGQLQKAAKRKAKPKRKR